MNLTFEEFANQVASKVTIYALYEDYRTNPRFPFEMLNGDRLWGSSKRNRKPEDVDISKWYIIKKWHSGGVEGGSCWDEGDAHHRPYFGEPEPEFFDLDIILTELSPKLSFIKYKEILKEIKIESFSYTEYEYYGNYSTYEVRAIKVRELYDRIPDETNHNSCGITR